ncbi:VIR protein [Plasmodium vivax]|uniref:VIR protein n=1 Tax=Plasmodium vivax TaxID=5855 RepID=A0A1G4HDH8_PLAVI|nr:VIR protein [Plasmodium vivax]
MEDNSILNIGKWKEIYPFLYKVWITYGLFDRSVDDSAHRSQYDVLCQQILFNMDANVNQYKDVCMKLMRNLEYYSPQSIYFNPTQERCNILYNWIYNLIREKKVTDDIIKKCFEEYNDYKNRISSDRRCDYFSYTKQFEKPMNIILLDIFENNMGIIKEELTRYYDKTELPLKKFLCESLKIYKNMKESHCNRSEVNVEPTKTCTKLINFKSSYSVFRTNIQNLYNKAPELDDIDNEFFDQCSSDEQKSSLVSSKGKNSCHAKEKGMTASVTISGNCLQDGFHKFPADAGKSLQEDMSTPPGNEDNSMKKTITTTVGTVAGASSLLALLYRFTPGRNWMRSGIRGSSGRINSNFYAEGPHELLFNGMDHNDFNSYSIGYEAM